MERFGLRVISQLNIRYGNVEPQSRSQSMEGHEVHIAPVS